MSQRDSGRHLNDEVGDVTRHASARSAVSARRMNSTRSINGSTVSEREMRQQALTLRCKALRQGDDVEAAQKVAKASARRGSFSTSGQPSGRRGSLAGDQTSQIRKGFVGGTAFALLTCEDDVSGPPATSFSEHSFHYAGVKVSESNDKDGRRGSIVGRMGRRASAGVRRASVDFAQSYGFKAQEEQAESKFLLLRGASMAEEDQKGVEMRPIDEEEEDLVALEVVELGALPRIIPLPKSPWWLMGYGALVGIIFSLVITLLALESGVRKNAAMGSYYESWSMTSIYENRVSDYLALMFPWSAVCMWLNAAMLFVFIVWMHRGSNFDARDIAMRMGFEEDSCGFATMKFFLRIMHFSPFVLALPGCFFMGMISVILPFNAGSDYFTDAVLDGSAPRVTWWQYTNPHDGRIVSDFWHTTLAMVAFILMLFYFIAVSFAFWFDHCIDCATKRQLDRSLNVELAMRACSIQGFDTTPPTNESPENIVDFSDSSWLVCPRGLGEWVGLFLACLLFALTLFNAVACALTAYSFDIPSDQVEEVWFWSDWEWIYCYSLSGCLAITPFCLALKEIQDRQWRQRFTQLGFNVHVFRSASCSSHRKELEIIQQRPQDGPVVDHKLVDTF